MKWYEALSTKRLSSAAHTFLLYLGTNDLLLRDGNFLELEDFLLLTSPCQDSEFVMFCDRANGIKFPTREMERKFEKFLEKLHPATATLLSGGSVNIAVNDFREHRRNITYAFHLFSELLEIGWNQSDPEIQERLEQAFGKDIVEKKKAESAPFLTVVFEHLESIAPHNAMHGEFPDRDALVTLLSWARNRKISDARNTIILVAQELTLCAPTLSLETNALLPIKIPFLDLEDRIQTLRILDKETGASDDGCTPQLDTYARISSGLSRRNLTQIVRETLVMGQPINEGQIFAKKKQHLEENSHGMLSLYRPIWGMQAIGALWNIKDYLERVAKAMREGDIFGVPQGIGLFGPPGTGKTVSVEALSFTSGLPFARWRNIRNMFVGESERRAEFIFELVINYVPLILFVDEMDEEFLMRGMMYHGDTGVSARIQKRFLEVFSDTNLRGRLLLIGASNKPEDVDQAFLREGRIDDVIPFVDLTAEERAEVGPAILHKLKCQAEAEHQQFEHEVPQEFWEEFGQRTHGHFKIGEGWSFCTPENCAVKDEETMRGFVGSEIEYIITAAYRRRAYPHKRALSEADIEAERENYIPKRDMTQFDSAIDAALMHCNSFEFIPERFHERTLKLRGASRQGTTVRYGQYL